MFQKKLFPIYLLTIVNTLGFSILLPILPYVMEPYNGGALFYGLILSVYSVFQFFACPFFGSLSDSFGRKKILIFTQVGTFLSWVVFGLALLIPPEYQLFGYADALIIILLARVVDGITGGNQVVANAYIADVTTEEERTSSFATIGVLTGIGLILGPVLGGLSSLGPWGYLGTAFVAGSISLVTLYFITFHLPESLPTERRTHKSVRLSLKENNVFLKIQGFMKNVYISHLFIVIFFFAFIFNGFVTVYLRYAKIILHANLMIASGLGAIVGIFFALNQAFVLRQLSKILNDQKLIFFGFIFLLVGLGLFTKIPQFWGFLGLSFLTTVGVALCLPTFKSMLTKHTDPSLQGTALGVEESLYALNRIIAPLIGGFIRGINKVAIFGLFSLLCLIPLFIVYKMIMSSRRNMNV